MRFRLVPVDDRFFELFADAIDNAVNFAHKLQEFISDPSDQAHADLKKIERQGDEITAETLKRLHSSFVTPVDREDIHALAENIDDAVDDMYAAVALIHLTKPGELPGPMTGAVDVLVRIAEASKKLIDDLEAMKYQDELLGLVNQLETEGDHLYRETIAYLFNGKHEALDVLKWKDISSAIEAAINSFEDISDVVESIVLKHA